MSLTPNLTLEEQFGGIDIYFFDQLQRGRITPAMRILDAGCGGGRNLIYLLREGAEVMAVDGSAEAIAAVRALAQRLGRVLPEQNLQVARIEQLPFADAVADVVICSAVLHFAQDEQHLRAMVRELARVLRPGGLLFARLGSRIGMEFEPVGNGRYRVGHGAEWFLVDEALLLELTQELDGTLLDPLKTTIVQGQRCMTTWVVRKHV